jgi:hypothetical protein
LKAHEYAVLDGFNRSKLGRIIAVVAGAISGVLVLAALSLVNVAERFGFSPNLPPTALSLLSAATVFLCIYWFFDNFMWRWRVVAKALRIPNIAGRYEVSGFRFSAEKSDSLPWEGEMTISQTWDRIRVHLKTSQSASTSVAAALHWDASEGFRLLYHYRNDPRTGERDLNAHRGFADILFTHDLTTADGEYFNGQGRFTFGRMNLTRIIDG